MLAALTLATALAALAAPRLRPPDAPPEAEGAADALRALARASAGEPPIGEVQEAAARRAGGTDDPDLARGRLAALLPRLSIEVRHDQRSDRVAGLQGAGEVDYVRFAPGNAISVQATWELSRLVEPHPISEATRASSDRMRRRDEAVKRATELYFERRKLRLALLLDPPREIRARAEAEISLDRITAELDALTGGLYARGRP
ncbi:MAG TPA: hypothetical protein VLU43_07970 [Anaeromyxobacteraceae bacterium]|nr:hypothetical protein [Anaeromyxobacteraceae bacterium]